MNRLFLVGLILFAAVSAVPAEAASATRGLVTTQRISTASPARYVQYQSFALTTANGSYLRQVINGGPGSARLVDIIVFQTSAGTVGTSWTLDVRTFAGTSLLTTGMTGTQASGGAGTDAKGALTLPSGWTRAVIKTDGTEIIAKGGVVQLYSTEAGSYSAHPSVVVALVFEPLQ